MSASFWARDAHASKSFTARHSLNARDTIAAMRAPLLFLLACLFVSSLAAQSLPPTTVLVSADMRPAQSLDGQWHYLVDPYRNGWGGWPNQPPLPSPHGYISDPHPTPTGPLAEWNWAKEPLLAVPGDWNSQRPELLYYEGLLWYERDFVYHPRPGTHAYLHFGAADYKANVAVNGINVCAHEGGYTSFDCDASSALKDGDNFIVVAVDNVRERDRVPTTKTDWWNYGGLTGGVSLITVPDAFIDDEGLTLDRGPGDHISGYAHVVGAPAGTPVTLHIASLGIDAHAKTDAQGRAAFSVDPQHLERWTPEQPKLYDVTFETGSDTLRDEVGFRTIEVQGDKILLNGKPIFLRGVSMHAEAPRHWPTWPESPTGRASSDADAKLLLGWVKSLNCNFVRMAHYPYPEPFLREADRMGLLAWSEIPVYWSIDWTSPAALASAQSQLHEMVRRDHNHAAIILWSMSNETPPGPERTQFIHTLIDQARSEDPSRLITSAIVTPFKKDADGHEHAMLDDPLDQYLDVLGYNEYIGWYMGKPDDAPSYIWADPTGKPVIMSEFGGGAKAGLHGSENDRWTEEYQAHLFTEQFKMLDKIPFLQGTTPWVLMDLRSPTRQLPDIQDGYNRKGLISDRGVKKEAYGVVKSHYAAMQAK
jgi:beta-glucuronidase